MSSKRYVSANLVLIALVVTVGYFLKPKSNLRDFETYQNFTVRVQKQGYLAEEHNVVTEDGFILKMFRMRHKGCLNKMYGPPVILQHGLLMCSDGWLDPGPNVGLAYLLADSCFDLWVGNTRGNYYSRAHVSLNPDKDAEFWQWSTDEIGKYDVPATIDYVLEYTGSTKLNYIGFSQGSGSVFIMCSERPGYCDKMNLLVGLGPSARQTNTPSVLYNWLTKSFDTSRNVLSTLGVNEVLSKGDFSQNFLELFCTLSSLTTNICVRGLGILDAYNDGSFSDETSRLIFNNFPAGTSVQNMARFGQMMKTENFTKFDYGIKKNLLVYGEASPPVYNLSAVTAPVVIIYGGNDRLVGVEDIKWLETKLPNLLESHLVKDSNWTHMDMMYSTFINDMIFPKIKKYLLQFSSCNDIIS